VSADDFRKMLSRTAEEAGLQALRVHPHMLRHATGYALANDDIDTRTIQAYLGHANIQHTTRCTRRSRLIGSEDCSAIEEAANGNRRRHPLQGLHNLLRPHAADRWSVRGASKHLLADRRVVARGELPAPGAKNLPDARGRRACAGRATRETGSTNASAP
jgi:hypothetical protein